MTKTNEDKFEFEKIVCIPDDMYGDIPHYIDCIKRLLYCMKEMNELYERNNELFSLTFRPDYHRPLGFKFTLKWGCKGKES